MFGPTSQWGDYWETDPAFRVTSSDTAGAAAALRAASARFSSIDESGNELEPWEVVQSEAYTPNYVSTVYVVPGGLMLWADTKGELGRAMGRAMVDVLVQELQAGGVEARVSRPEPSLGALLDRAHEYEFPAEQATEPSAAPTARDAPKTWWISRPVRRQTVDGRRFTDCEFWSADGGWSRDRTAADTFAEPPIETVYALRAQENADDNPARMGEATALLLTADQDPWPMPPAELRG